MNTYAKLTIVALALFGALGASADWQPPKSEPPTCVTDPAAANYQPGCNTPVHVGTEAQDKQGILRVRGFRSFFDAIFDTNVQVGGDSSDYAILSFKNGGQTKGAIFAEQGAAGNAFSFLASRAGTGAFKFSTKNGAGDWFERLKLGNNGQITLNPNTPDAQGSLAVEPAQSYANPDKDLAFDANGKVGATEYCDANGDNCFLPGSFGFWASSGNNNIKNTNTGRVGIATETPATLLNVHGDVGASEYCDENGENCVTQLQQRITGECAEPGAIRKINPDGTVVCTGGGSSGGNCGPGQALQGYSEGLPVCVSISTAVGGNDLWVLGSNPNNDPQYKPPIVNNTTKSPNVSVTGVLSAQKLVVRGDAKRGRVLTAIDDNGTAAWQDGGAQNSNALFSIKNEVKVTRVLNPERKAEQVMARCPAGYVAVGGGIDGTGSGDKKDVSRPSSAVTWDYMNWGTPSDSNLAGYVPPLAAGDIPPSLNTPSVADNPNAWVCGKKPIACYVVCLKQVIYVDQGIRPGTENQLLLNDQKPGLIKSLLSAIGIVD